MALDPINQMQALTDVEGHLVDAAVAVAAAPSSQTSVADIPHGPISLDTVLDGAEEVENMLEQAIDSIPGPEKVDAFSPGLLSADDAIEQSVAEEPEITQEITVSDPSADVASAAVSDVVHEAEIVLAAVATDIDNPVLPDSVLLGGLDQVANTSADNVAENSAVAEPITSVTHIPVASHAGIHSAAPVLAHSTVIDPVPVTNTSVTFAPADYSSELKVPMPSGLSSSSPSVAANPDLVRSWRQDPSDNVALAMFNWSVQKTEIGDARAWYEVLALENPTAAQPLLALINLELALSNFSEVEALFARALRSPTTLMAAADINIWKAYLHYIRRQNPAGDGNPDAEKARSTVKEAYEFALKECGVDRESGDIWQEYIAYLAEAKSKNPWDAQQQVDTIRKVYQRAVSIPLNNVEALWKAYDAFESGNNKQTAKKFLADRSPSYMTARTALREFRALTDILPHPILPPSPDFSDDDRRVVTSWRAYIKWEESNPLASDDTVLVGSRIGYALRKCLAQMRHFPEMWHYAATYHLGAGKEEEGIAFLKAGLIACPKSFLLAFALAETEENQKNYSDCHTIFESLITQLNTEIDELKISVAAEVETARGPEIPIVAKDDFDINGEDEESDVARLVREREERGKLVEERRGKDIDDVKAATGIAWVMYMRFARRAEGIKAARLVFGKARKSPHVTWHIFEASALMEYHSNKDSAVAIRIFELGLKLFADDVSYVTKYLQFLLSINDDTNARALFERSALKIASEKARPLWETWARFEYMYGDLAAVHKLEARFAETFPNDSPLKRFAQRYAYNGIDEIALRDLGFGRPRTAPTPPLPVPVVAASAPAPTLPPFPPPGQLGIAAPALAPTAPARHSPLKRDRSPPQSPSRSISDVPIHKRHRGVSPQPPRNPSARFDREPPARFAAQIRERSPPPGPRGGIRAAQLPPAPPVAIPPYQQYDRSGVPKPLAWFVGSLPSARLFDGPVFRADDVIGLFSNIAPNGAGIAHAPTPAPVHARGPPPPTGRNLYQGAEVRYRNGSMRGRY